MDNREEDFLKKLRLAFITEAEEHLLAISSGLLELEKVPLGERYQVIIEAVFREAHSLKGAARAVNLAEIEAICQSLESLFASLKRRDLALSPQLFDMLHSAVDGIKKLLSSPGDGAATISAEIIHQLSRLETGEGAALSQTEDLPQKLSGGNELSPPRKDMPQARKEPSEASLPLTPERQTDPLRHGQAITDKPTPSETIRI